MQHIIVYIVLALAIGFAVWYVYKSFQRHADPCCGCEGCPLRQESGDRRQESGDRRQESGDRSQETGDRSQ